MHLIQFANNTGDLIEQGDVVVIGQTQTPLYHDFDKNIVIPEVDLAVGAYDTRVCGVVCELQAYVRLQTLEEMNAGGKVEIQSKAKDAKKVAETERISSQGFTAQELEKMDRTKIESGQIGMMIMLGAFTHCKVDADIASIKVGDLLTTSPTKGHAQKVVDPSKATGAIIGKALGALKKGKGKIPVLVMLQ